ncbi:acyl-CoA dehydrogenase [Williamsia sp.]|uniref:acyl-CoA dehydrogenase n=1 Tax=Williamsia sp. TaxID=1872085 RepID=UPI002F9490B4
MSLTVTRDQQDLAASTGSWGERCGLRAAARAGVNTPPGDRSTEPPLWWAEAVDLGLPALSIPESAGGVGATVEESSIVIAELGYRIATGPMATSAVGALVLATQAAGTDAHEVLRGVADGSEIVVVALVGDTQAIRTADGWLVSGDAGYVIGAQEATRIILSVRTVEGMVWIVVPKGEAVTVTPIDSVDVTRPSSRVTISDALVGAESVLAGVDTELVLDLWITMTGAEAAGIARWAQETAMEYAKVRVQFGRAIGSFQSIKHLCADMLARSEMAGAAAWDAAGAATAYLRLGDDESRRQLAVAAGAAGVVALENAVLNAKDCIQVLGGIGMTWEHDAHLSLRRALTLREMSGGSDHWRARMTEVVRAGVRREWAVSLGTETDRLRNEISELIARLPVEEGKLRIALADEGLIAPHWPEPYGRGATAIEQILIAEELNRNGIRVPDIVVGNWALPTIIEFGTEEQRDQFVSQTLRGEITWCQMFSEPGAGSDLASLRTRAERVDGGWMLNGQKVWTSNAMQADWAICLARTDPASDNHRGITYFIVNVRDPGVEVRPLREITGDAVFNEVFLDDVFVPDHMVVGQINDGWKLARATLASERVAIAANTTLGDGLDELVAETPANLLFDNRLGELLATGQVVKAVGQQIALRQIEGLDPGPSASIRKLVAAHFSQSASELAMSVLGTAGLDMTDKQAAQRVSLFMLTRSGTIAGGSSQIMRNIIAERLLGLPRD